MSIIDENRRNAISPTGAVMLSVGAEESSIARGWWAFVAYIGLLYVLSRGSKRLFRRLEVTPSVEAITRVLLGVAAAAGLIFIIRGLEALSLP